MLKDQIKNVLEKALGEIDDVEIVVPENKQFGHYFTNVALRLAKKTGKNPMEVAQKLTNNLQQTTNNFFSKIEVVQPGFINFWLKPEIIQKELVEIYKIGKNFGQTKFKKKPIMVIDYSHPNIAKPMSVAHLRSTIIGQALYNIFKFSGWKTIGDNHLGDWGKQFGILIAAYKTARGKKKVEEGKEIKIEDLMAMYVDYTARMKEDKKLEEIAKLETKKLQNGDRENVLIWKQFYKISLDEFKKVYKILGVKFDYYLGESFYNKMLPKIIEEALKKGVAEKSEGAIIIPIKNKAPFVIQKSDEAFLYSTTDIAAIKYRVERFKPSLILYVVDNGQSLHFEQLFESAKKLGYIEAEQRGKENDKEVKLVHAKFGLILSEDMKKLSTRAGKHISLLEVIDEAINRAKKIVEGKRPDLSKKEKNKIAEIVGVGALKYNDLSQNRQSDIAFKWDKMLNLEGNSGPYIQYTYARLRSILRKAKGESRKGKGETEFLKEEVELNLILKLEEFPEVIQRITENYYPHYLAEYLYKLAQEANNFYHKFPVLKAEKNVKEARLALIDAISKTLKTGLNILGIDVLEKM